MRSTGKEWIPLYIQWAFRNMENWIKCLIGRWESALSWDPRTATNWFWAVEFHSRAREMISIMGRIKILFKNMAKPSPSVSIKQHNIERWAMVDTAEADLLSQRRMKCKLIVLLAKDKWYRQLLRKFRYELYIIQTNIMRKVIKIICSNRSHHQYSHLITELGITVHKYLPWFL